MPSRKYVNRIVYDLRLDLVERIHHVERAARDSARALGELLSGFPQTYATKADLEHVRTTADQLQIHLVNRERFERFENEIGERFKVIEHAQGRGAAVRSTIVAVAFIVVTISLVLLATTKQSVDRVDTRTQKLEHEIIVLQQQVLTIQALDRFFCRTRTPGLPAC